MSDELTRDWQDDGMRICPLHGEHFDDECKECAQQAQPDLDTVIAGGTLNGLDFPEITIRMLIEQQVEKRMEAQQAQPGFAAFMATMEPIPVVVSAISTPLMLYSDGQMRAAYEAQPAQPAQTTKSFAQYWEDTYGTRLPSGYTSEKSFAEAAWKACAMLEVYGQAQQAQPDPAPVAWLHCDRPEADVITTAAKEVWGKAVVGSLAQYTIPLYRAQPAQPAPLPSFFEANASDRAELEAQQANQEGQNDE